MHPLGMQIFRYHCSFTISQFRRERTTKSHILRIDDRTFMYRTMQRLRNCKYRYTKPGILYHKLLY